MLNKIDGILSRVSLVSQILLEIFAIYLYSYTVRPIFNRQKVL